MNDSRLTAVRLATDRRLFELFMENYVKALSMTTRRLFNHFTGSMDFQVSPINFKEGHSYQHHQFAIESAVVQSS